MHRKFRISTAKRIYQLHYTNGTRIGYQSEHTMDLIRLYSLLIGVIRSKHRLPLFA